MRIYTIELIMLKTFTVRNYKSIRKEMTLELHASTVSEHKESIIKGQNGEKILPVSVIYGPNGGGKSNLIEALCVICHRILHPIYAVHNIYKFGEKIRTAGIRTFMFDPDAADEPTEFRIVFTTLQADYVYIIHIKEEKVVYESLKRKSNGKGKWAKVFERTGNEIVPGEGFTQFKVCEGMSDVLPFLSYLGIVNGKNEVVSDVIDWFGNGINFLNYGNPAHELNTPIPSSHELQQLTSDMLREMDLGIDGLRVEKAADQIDIYLRHTINGKSVEIPFEDESSGVRKILGIIPLLAISRIWGSTLVIDELDAKLHPRLLQYIIELYSDVKGSNKSGAQLIFTSHDLTTMSNELLRRDEIWLMEKGELQESQLRRLSEIKNEKEEAVRKDAKFEKQYMEGKYGALPAIPASNESSTSACREP